SQGSNLTRARLHPWWRGEERGNPARQKIRLTLPARARIEPFHRFEPFDARVVHGPGPVCTKVVPHSVVLDLEGPGLHRRLKEERKDAVKNLDQRGGGPTVGLQVESLSPLLNDAVAQILKHRSIGSTERVDRLLPVADDPQLA